LYLLTFTAFKPTPHTFKPTPYTLESADADDMKKH